MKLPLLLLALCAAVLVAAPARAQDTVTICHSTGSAENPYTELNLDNAGVLDHVNHEDDLVPAPAGGCPTTTVVDPEETPTATATPQYQVPTPTATAAPVPTATPDRKRDRDRDDDDAGGGVKGDGGEGGGAPSLSDSPPAAAQEQQAQGLDSGQLPMTGGEMWLVAAVGIGFLLSGFGVRLLFSISPAAAGRPPGPSDR